MKVCILGDNHELVSGCVLPNSVVLFRLQAHLPHMYRAGENVRETPSEARGEILVESSFTNLGGTEAGVPYPQRRSNRLEYLPDLSRGSQQEFDLQTFQKRGTPRHHRR